jgi:hypothetical protein
MVPIEFLRQFRLDGYAIFDFVAAFLGIYLLVPLLSKSFRKIGIEIPRLSWLFLTLPIAVLSHLIFGNATPMTMDFIDLSGHYFLKILILILLILGLRGVRKIKK